MDDNHTQDVTTQPEEDRTPEMPAPSQPNGSTPTDLPPEAPESPISVPDPIPVESQNGGVNEAESKPVEPPKDPQIEEISVTPVQPAPAPQTSVAPQPQSLAQQDQAGFIRALLAKANAKLHSNRQKKLDNLMLMAQKKRIITNDDVQKLLRVSDATATRYLVKLVEQGRLALAGNPRDAKYQFLH